LLQLGSIKQMSEQVQGLFKQFWSAERLAALVTSLVRVFMPLTARELDEWSDSEEQFYSSGIWEDSPRVFAQTLYSCLLAVGGTGAVKSPWCMNNPGSCIA
jgi:hypothetical protein